MKQQTLSTTFALAALAVSPLSQALPISGEESNDTYIEVGESTVNCGPHSDEMAGIGVYTLGTSNKVDFQGLAGPATEYQDVHVLSSPIDTDPPAPDHTGMGVFAFSQVGEADVWYGEWSQTGGPSYSNRAVYYVGDTDGTTVPTAGTNVAYSVEGISRFNPSAQNDLSGTFEVDFVNEVGSSDVEGYIENNALRIDVAADITGSSFSGTATADDFGIPGSNDASGSSEGEFYGANAAALAGMATFSGSDSQYNTAFGGTKD